MFEQLNMTRKLKRQIGKAVSIALSAAMLVTALPAELLGGVASVKAAEKTYTFGLSDLTMGTNGDTVSGSYGTEKYFTMAGKVTQYVNKEVLTAIYLDKNEAGEIDFTVKGTATVVAEVRSNSNTNISPVALKNKGTGEYIVATNITRGGTSQEELEKDLASGYYLVHSSSTSTLTYTVPAGTYALLSPTVSSQSRGVRVTAMTVTETTTGGENPGPGDGDVSGGDNTGDDGTNDGGDKTWDFTAVATDDKVTIQSAAGEYQGLKIDATNNGKFDTRGSDVQINAGTKVQIPVDGNCEITVVAYDDNYAKNYTLNGEAASGATHTFTYTGPKGYVDLVATAQTYLFSISTKHMAAPEYIEEGSYVFFDTDLGYEENIAKIKGLTLEGGFNYGNKHGFQAKDADSAMVLNLSDSATIVVTTCVYGNGDLKSSTGTVTSVDVGEEGGNGKEYTIKGANGKTTLTLGASAYVHSVSVTYDKEVTLDPNKSDVWDFGAMTVKDANNLLTVDVINGFYPAGTVAGTAGVTISSFEAKDQNGNVAIRFVSDKTNNRLRTNNKAITRYDEKGKNGANSAVYEGYLYSNNTSTLDTVKNSVNRESAEAGRADHLDIYLYEGDTLTCMLGSNSNPANYRLYDPDNNEYAEFDFTNTYGVEAAVFHAAGEGWYKLYCTDEKLVCARITREHAPKVGVSGSIDISKAAGIPADYGVIYTNTTTGYKTEMTVESNAYVGILSGGYSYNVSLKNANGYVVRGGRSLEVAAETVKNDLTVETVDQKTISGSVTGLLAYELEKVKFEFEIPEGYVFEPQFELNTVSGAYTLKVENGVTYNVTALDVNDSVLKITTISATADKTADIEFEKKPVYKVTLDITGVEDTSNALVTFTNVNEMYTDGKTPYSYNFEGLDNISLRDGDYSVKVAGFGKYAVAQSYTANVKVKGAPVSSAKVPFNKLSTWDFAKLNDVIDIETIDNTKYYAGLVLTDSLVDENGKTLSVSKNKTYLLGGKDTKITVPGLTAGDVVTITYCYNAAFKLSEGDVSTGDVGEVYGTASGSTSQFESVEYIMQAEGDLVITNVEATISGKKINQSYLCSINVLRKADQVPYSDKITVGKDKTYKTINEALAAVRNMIRTDDQKVTIMIDPGDYEEMLVLDTPNVTLKNAAAAPSIELKNKGVDIDENAVRVTWYYGHGYTYYSMGSDCKYDAELFEVNKANGYASFKNPGSGTTNGSYWNATVVVTADNISAEGIIFENSFNQYMSKKAAEDYIEKQSGAKEGAVARAEMEAGDTTVQDKKYVERAAALAIYNNKKQISFDNCKFIGHQDTLYGGTGVTAAFYNCSVYGGTDYIFGGMTAVFAKCDLVFNTMEDGNDVGYITAAQTPANQRGLLMWNCTVTSTTPGVDTAAQYTSKAGYLGRPWQANSGEAVFYETIVEATCPQYFKDSASLIQPAGWNSSLGGESVLSQEYNTHEWAYDVYTGAALDNSAKRVSWSKVLTEEEAKAITPAAFLGDWDAFAGKDMTIEVPNGMGAVNNMPVGSVDASKMTLTNLGADANGKGQVLLTWQALHKSQADKYVITVTNKDVTTETAKTYEVDNTSQTQDGDDAILEKTLTDLTVDNTYEVSIGTERGDGADKEQGTPAVKTIVVSATKDPEPGDGPQDPVNGTRFDLEITLDGLTGGQRYRGGFSVTEDFYPYGKKDATTGDKKTVVGTDYDIWVQGTTNPKTGGKNPNGKIPDTGAALVLDALADGVVTFICANAGKGISFVDATNGGDGVAIMAAVDWEDKIYKFEVKAGHKYYFYAEGSKLMLCGAYVVYEGQVEDPDDDNGSFDGWDKVAKPVINSVEYTSGDGEDKLTVTVTANVGKEGGESLDVTVQKVSDTAKTETKTSKDKQTQHRFEFKVDGPGKYEITAVLKRKGQTDKITKKTYTINANGTVSGRQGLYVELLDDDTDYIYTGGAIKPAIAVYNNDELLTEGTDYTVKYSNNVKAAKKDSGKKAPTITVTGKGRFTGKTTQTFTIQPRDLEDVVIGGLSKDAADTLIVVENAKISPVLVYKGVLLKAGDKKDFTLTTGLNKDKPTKADAGKEITITGVNNYTGTLTLKLDVKSKSELKKISTVKIDKTVKYEYDGTEKDVVITEVKAGRDVVAAEDYLVVYNGDKTSAGTQKFTIVGVGIYAGSKTSSYKISPRKTTLKLANALADASGVVTCGFNSAGVTFNDALTVTDEGLNNAELVLGKDYKVSYSANKKVGTGKYTVTFLGNYKGSAALKNNTFTITAANLAEMTQTEDPSAKDGLYLKSADKAYTKAAAYKSAPYVLVNGVALKTSDYTVKYYLDEGKTTEMKGKNKVTLGADETSKTVYVEIIGKKNYSGTVMTSFDVIKVGDKTDISKATITLKDSSTGKKQSKVEYTGEAVYPDSIEIKVGRNAVITLKPDANGNWDTADYEVTFVNNIEKGKATVIITGTGSNVGSKTATYSVVAQDLKNVPAEFWDDFSTLKSLLGL